MPIGKTRPKTNEEKIEKIKNVYKAKYKLNKLGETLFNYFNEKRFTEKIFLHISKEDFENQYRKDNLFSSYDELIDAYKLVNCDFSTSELEKIKDIDQYFIKNSTKEISDYTKIKENDFEKFHDKINVGEYENDKYLALAIATFQVYLINFYTSIDGSNWLYKRIDSVFNYGTKKLISNYFKSGRENYNNCQRNLWHIVKFMFEDKLAFPSEELSFANDNEECFIQYIRCHLNKNFLNNNITVNKLKKSPVTLKVTSEGFELDQNIDIDALAGKLFLQDAKYSSEYHQIEKKVQSGSEVWFLTNDQIDEKYCEKFISDIDSDGDKISDNVLYRIKSELLEEFIESLDDYELSAAPLKKIRLVGGIVDPISSAKGEKHKYLTFGLPKIEIEDNLKAENIKLKRKVEKILIVQSLKDFSLPNLKVGLYELFAEGYRTVEFEVKDAFRDKDKDIRDKCGWKLNSKFEINDSCCTNSEVNLCGLNIF